MIIGKLLKKAVNGFQLKKYRNPKFNEDSIFQFDTPDASLQSTLSGNPIKKVNLSLLHKIKLDHWHNS